MAAGTIPDVRYCSLCGQPSPEDEFAHFGDTQVCALCKAVYVQRLREGVPPVLPTHEYAGFWIRAGAAFIDGALLMLAGGALQAVLMTAVSAPVARIRPNAPPEESLQAVGAMVGVAMLGFLLSTAMGASYEGFFVSRLGATPGKMALGLRVIRPNGANLTLGRAIGRYFAKSLSMMTLLVGYIMAGFDQQKRAMHDMICDTRVVHVDRSPIQLHLT